jgi:dolichyl-phosphate beta-glucosyltransferase
MMLQMSVIIPVYNEAARLSVCLEKMIPYLNKHYPYSNEIVIVDNGSTDGTRQIIQCYTNTFRTVLGLHLSTRGKGLAIQRGMLFANGRWRYMCDVDLSTPIEELSSFVNTAYSSGADVVIGSRELIRAAVSTTWTRRVIGRVFHLMVADLVPGVLDTQCGFKLFSGMAANAIFCRSKVSGWAFDVEALYLARLMGLRVYEMPVRWQHNPDSRVRFVRDTFEMARDVVSIPWLHTQLGKKIAA